MKNVKETTLFTSNGESIGLTMLDFWKYQYSNIFDLQENIAEFIVGKALGLTEPCNRNGWSLFDIFYRKTRIEIKETGYFYSWQKDGKISQQRTFGIAPSLGPNKVRERQNDIYVFCLNTGINEEESNPLEMDNWKFYVVPTSVINKECADEQKTISLSRVKKLAPLTKYGELKGVIDSYIDAKQL